MIDSPGLIIGVVGTIGSGKTTLGKALAKDNGWVFLEEDWKSNPYVVGEKATYASQLQISLGFLELRKKQYLAAEVAKKEGKIVLMDTVFEMTDIYSKHTLSKEEYKKFKKQYSADAEDVRPPDGVIYLHGDYGVLRNRALSRNWGVKLEKDMVRLEVLKKTDSLIKTFLLTMDRKKILPYNAIETDFRLKEVREKISSAILQFKDECMCL